VALGTRLDLAALVLRPGLAGVLIANVNLYPSEHVFEPRQGIYYRAANPLLQTYSGVDLVAVDLYLHVCSPNGFDCKDLSCLDQRKGCKGSLELEGQRLRTNAPRDGL
jgi:hypothetical protein